MNNQHMLPVQRTGTTAMVVPVSRRFRRVHSPLWLVCLLILAIASTPPAHAQLAIKAKALHTMGPAGTIENGVVVFKDGKVAAVGPAASTPIPAGLRIIETSVVTPGLVDAHGTVGLSGIFNTKADSDQLEHSAPVQPELRAVDAYNPQEKLIEFVRSFGVTTVHTGHAPGELISGQTLIVKTVGNTTEEAKIVAPAMVAVTLSPQSLKGEGKSPGTRGKQMAMLRAELIKAQEYKAKVAKAEADKKPPRDLHLEMLAEVLDGKVPLLVTAHRAQDIASVLRLADEFKVRVVLDGAAEGYVLADQIKAAKVPVILHPPMMRSFDELQNATFESAAKLHKAGIPIALQSGYEGYVPKTRVVLFEAAIAAANGLTFQEALATITIDAARILGVDQRVGSLEIGKDADAAIYDGDPFEYTSHCTGTVINGKVVFEGKR